jgi:ABC-type branched-subunit amino acid transport system ATPase component
MLISEIKIKGYKSFGNNEQTLKLNTENGELILLVGSNGNGKCVDKKTLIELDIDDLYLTDELITFLVETEKGNKIFLYIKEKKPLLYEKFNLVNI